MKGNFNQLVSGATPVLVDFHAEWCGPCKMQAPILKEVAREMGDELRVIAIDIDKNQELAARYQVRSVPTLLLFRQGKVLWKNSGLVQKPALLAQLRNSR